MNAAESPKPEYAGFWTRLLASAIDIVLLSGCVWFGLRSLAYAAGPLLVDQEVSWEKFGPHIYVLSFTLNHGSPWLYEATFTASAWQATPGKRLLGLEVHGTGGQRIGFGRATARHFGKYLWFGLFIQPLTERRQALHDKIAGTVVVRAERRR